MEQPVHGRVELFGVDVLKAQRRPEGGGCAIAVQLAGGGELGAGGEDARGDEGEAGVALAAGARVQEAFEPELVHCAEDGCDMAVGQGTFGEEEVVGGDEHLAAQGAADEVDEVVGEM